MADHDFIVVGTGPAGSCVAARLSKLSDVSVLALEACSEPYPDNVTNPAHAYTLFGAPIDWGPLWRSAMTGRAPSRPAMTKAFWSGPQAKRNG